MTHLKNVDREIPLPPPWRYFGMRGSQVRGGWVGPEHLDEVRYDLQDFNLFVHLNPSRGLSVRARTETVTGWRAVLVDLDPVGVGVIQSRESDGVIAAASELLGLDVDPAVIDTGRGIHLWLLFPEVSPAPEWAGQAMKGFLTELGRRVDQPGWRVDTAVFDVTRIARMPGSVNLKTGRPCSVLREGHAVAGIPEKLEARFRQARRDWEEKSDHKKETRLPASGPWGLYLTCITEAAARYLTEGASEGERHAAAVKAAYSLKDHGCSYAEILSALRFGNTLCEDPLSLDEIASIAFSCWRRKPRGDQHGTDLQAWGATP